MVVHSNVLLYYHAKNMKELLFYKNLQADQYTVYAYMSRCALCQLNINPQIHSVFLVHSLIQSYLASSALTRVTGLPVKQNLSHFSGVYSNPFTQLIQPVFRQCPSFLSFLRLILYSIRNYTFSKLSKYSFAVFHRKLPYSFCSFLVYNS